MEEERADTSVILESERGKETPAEHVLLSRNWKKREKASGPPGERLKKGGGANNASLGFRRTCAHGPRVEISEIGREERVRGYVGVTFRGYYGLEPHAHRNRFGSVLLP